MKTLLIALLIASPVAAGQFRTVAEYQNDFDKATICKPIDGRMVWKGKIAFYIQSTLFYTSASGQVSEDSASVIPVATNPKKALAQFYKACE